MADLQTTNMTATLLQERQTLGSCRIERFLGRGGMGEVYLARHLRLDCQVVVKVLPPAKLEASHIERFRKEARAAARVKHPNVVTIHDLGEENRQHYIVMEWVEGRNLTEIIHEQGGPLPWRSALRIIRLAAKGLGAVHACKLIHRDIKPSNIMVTRDSRVLLMDFGLVRDDSQAELTSTGVIVGTPAFMSPEQCRGEPIDSRSDIFSLGATLYFLLTARLPFDGTSVANVLTRIASGRMPPPVSLLNQFVPREVEGLVQRAMSFKAGQRFASAEDFAHAITHTLKAIAIADAPTAETSRMSIVQTATVSQDSMPNRLPEIELLADEDLSASQIVLTRQRWMIAAMAFAACVMIATMLNGLFGNAPSAAATSVNSEDKPRARPTPKPTAPDATAKTPPLTTPQSRPIQRARVEGMVRIPAGQVVIGDQLHRLKAFFERVAADRKDPNLTPLLLQNWDATNEISQTVPAFWIDAYEVTNKEYSEFVKARGHRPPAHWAATTPKPEELDLPVTHIDHADALAFATWAGKKLPTEAQWLRAFRGDTRQLFPWGNEFEAHRTNVFQNRAFPVGLPSAVRASPNDLSSFGVFNLVGNVREMLRDKTYVNGVEVVVVKGSDFRSDELLGIGSWRLYWHEVNNSLRETNNVGFRCVLED